MDIDFHKVLSCIKRGVSAYQGDIKSFLNQFEDNAFDRVILSRTVDQLEEPDWIISKSLQVGVRVTVGFVNNGYWENRCNAFFRGAKTVNEVYLLPWYESLPANSFSIAEFESYCQKIYALRSASATREIEKKSKIFAVIFWRVMPFMICLAHGQSLSTS